MFDAYKREQPTPPTDVALYLESERGRIVHEMERGPTTYEDRELLEQGLEATFAAYAAAREDPSAENLSGAARYSSALHAVFVFNSVQQTLPGIVEYLQTPAAERRPDQAFLETTTTLGKVILHGLKVAGWFQRHRDQQLTEDNVVSATVATVLADNMGGIKEAKRLGRLYTGIRVNFTAPGHKPQ